MLSEREFKQYTLPLNKMVLNIHIDPDEYLKWYQGVARQAIVPNEQGQRVSIPVNALQPYMTGAGVHGRFRIYFNQDHKLVYLEKLK